MHKTPSNGGRLAFIHQFVKRLSYVVESSYRSESTTFGAVRRGRNELDTFDIVLLQIDRSGKFGVLLVPIFKKKVDSVVSSLFQPFEGSMKQSH